MQMVTRELFVTKSNLFPTFVPTNRASWKTRYKP